MTPNFKTGTLFASQRALLRSNAPKVDPIRVSVQGSAHPSTIIERLAARVLYALAETREDGRGPVALTVGADHRREALPVSITAFSSFLVEWSGSIVAATDTRTAFRALSSLATPRAQNVATGPGPAAHPMPSLTGGIGNPPRGHVGGAPPVQGVPAAGLAPFLVEPTRCP